MKAWPWSREATAQLLGLTVEEADLVVELEKQRGGELAKLRDLVFRAGVLLEQVELCHQCVDSEAWLVEARSVLIRGNA